MTFDVKSPLVVAAVYIWIGFVGAISFMEAWLKFRAPGVTLPVGLGIGRLVFHALQKVEWALVIIIVLSGMIGRENFFSPAFLFFYVAAGLLLLQTIWLLPVLDARAVLQIRRQAVPPSSHHLYYAGMEVVKVISLISYSFYLFK